MLNVRSKGIIPNARTGGIFPNSRISWSDVQLITTSTTIPAGTPIGLLLALTYVETNVSVETVGGGYGPNVRTN